MRILVLGGDGYLGWPTAMYFSSRDNEVAVVDNFIKRKWEKECGVAPLFPILPLDERIKAWKSITKRTIKSYIGDLTDYNFTASVMRSFRPHAVIHYGEQPSAPFSMASWKHAAITQSNNIIGSLNVLFALKEFAPKAHLVKLGTMGEYGTPNIDIEEGFIEIEHNGRKDLLPFPKQPGSFYHLSKVHDSHNMAFACKIWKLRGTDLNQGVVYGVETSESRLDERLATSFHYDHIFGTVLNRFCVQAILGKPLTIYGKGGQRRGFLNIMDTLQCVELAVIYPPEKGEYRVFNQFTEVFSVRELADAVVKEAAKLGYKTKAEHLPNPRVELESHYYNPKHSKLVDLGLKPVLLSNTLIDTMLVKISKFKNRIREKNLLPDIQWTAHEEASHKPSVKSKSSVFRVKI